MLISAALCAWYFADDVMVLLLVQAMGEIHAINKEGTVIRNVQVFAR